MPIPQRLTRCPEKRMNKREEVAKRIADELAASDIKMIASLPDDWIADLIKAIDGDTRFKHVPVNREESAVGLCSGAYMTGTGAAALMGASGFMTLIYAITKINYTYEIPILILITLRGGFGDIHQSHLSNGLYLKPVMDSISLPYTIVDKPDDIPLIGQAYRHSRVFSRPTVVALTHGLLR
jgi:sulfopyruvate decarboxylase alpha subunit